MNKKLFFFLLLITNSIFSQEFLNLDFEYTLAENEQPEIWVTGDSPYKITIDTIVKFNQKKSIRIDCKRYNENSFGYTVNKFPIKYAKGKSLELKGKVRTENVIKGYAGIWLNANNDDETITFDNMNDRGLTNSNDWTEVSIKLKINKTVNKITFGVLLTGQGKAWFDDLEIFIDGEKFKDKKPKYLEPTKDELNWLKQNIHPLKSFEPDTKDDDLKILSQLVGNAKIVALGETTHGSSEIFKMKHRIIKYLAVNEEFDIFSIEANMPESYDLNEYIIDGSGNPKDLLRGIYFWTWRTKEVLDMIEWMKGFNKSNQKMRFTGFDMKFYHGAIKELETSFKNKNKSLKLISELKNDLNRISNQRVNTQEIRDVAKLNANYVLNLIKKNASQINTDKDWLLQNIRIIEQYLNNIGSRDKYMAENLLWIKKQNQKSKIIAWAHNGHIKKTDNKMGEFLSDSLNNDYLSIGFTFFKGNYTAVGSNGLTSYVAQEAKLGSYEYTFNQINEPIFLLDLRQVKKEQTELNKWLLEELTFRDVGALKTVNEFYKTDLTKDFDIIIFIKESSNSTLLD